MTAPTIEQLTAHALGEGTADERAHIDRWLTDHPEAQAEIEAIRSTAAMLTEHLASSGLDQQRKAALAHLQPVQTEAPHSAPRLRFPAWLPVVATGALAATLVVAVMPQANPPTMPTNAPATIARPKKIEADSRTLAKNAAELKAKDAANGALGYFEENAAAGVASAAPAMPSALAPATTAAEGVAAESADQLLRQAPATPLAVPEPLVAHSDYRAVTPTNNLDRSAVADSAPLQTLPIAPPPARAKEAAKRQAANFLATGALVPDDGKRTEGRDDQDSYVRLPVQGWTHVGTASDDPGRRSTFGADVDTGSYSNARRFLFYGQLPPIDAVRSEEFINSFRYRYPAPPAGQPLAVASEMIACPWAPQHRLVRLGISSTVLDSASRPTANLVFLVDVSGSMNQPTKLPLVQRSLTLLSEQLRDDDRVAIVTYAGNAGVALPATRGSRRAEIVAAIEGLSAGGSTHGAGGIVAAYDTARSTFVRGGVNRIILCTDGDFNVGATSSQDLEQLIQEKAASGIFLTALGFGMGDYRDITLQTLADCGNGHYAYIDTEAEARRQLVDSVTSTLVTVAKDVKIQVEFNPKTVQAWRLIGYEKRHLAAQDFLDDRKDGGEIGAGHQVTALYEVIPRGTSGGGDVPALRYQVADNAAPATRAPIDSRTEVLTISLRWKLPDGNRSTGISVPVIDQVVTPSTDTLFAASVAEIAQRMRGSEGPWDLDRALRQATTAAEADRDRQEFIDLVRKAQQLGLR